MEDPEFEQSVSIVGLIAFFLNQLRDQHLVAPCVFCGYPVPTPLRLPDDSYRCLRCLEDEPSNEADTTTPQEGEDG